ncbi:hypothetical protein SPBR_05158 [Sporothrix brasiliensis 5110]|uniref:Calcineurin-like phosphoesterase domain-containing protein n=1 Tax=Sporothrix brasiliensis 5110 TaxID=1398154 RepID=A0A0C2EMS4_9PEZI|nr:uncharacterized protein SPBR_05158 [Sporothrix brasiliensis 5110]KIH87414.1 hypothetical protein SPBR_05158 [Sporothrix brasiliensis 5110]
MEDQQQQHPPPKPLTSIKLRGQTKKRLAARLLQIHLRGRPASVPTTTTTDTTTAEYKPVRVVCVADTHNTQPVLPAGDVLIHAGDLSDRGSFAEVQAGLSWLAAQPHQHKILVAGNHDVLLDDAFLEKHPERRYGQSATETRRDLDWGDVTYLQDRHVTIRVGARSLTIYGSPWTPAYGVSAFQYRPDCPTHWSERLRAFSPAQPPDILVTHGPPKLHRDQRDFYRAGCAYLAEQVARLRPRLCVFGHIHAAYGREDVLVDAVRWQHDTVAIGWAGWAGVVWMLMLVVWAKTTAMLAAPLRIMGIRHDEKVTTFVNAAVVGGPDNKLRNPPIVVEI